VSAATPLPRLRLASLTGPVVTALVVGGGAVALLAQTRSTSELGPYPDGASYAYQAVEFARGNFFGGIPAEIGEGPLVEGWEPTRYPPGFPMVLALGVAALRGGVPEAQLMSALVVVALLVAVAIAGRRLGGWAAAAIAPAILLATPFVWRSATVVMADAFGALCAVVCLILIHAATAATRSDRSRVALFVAVGFVGGLAINSRFALVILVLAAFAALRRPRDLVPILLGLAPWIVWLAVFQTIVFGAPWMTGYDYFVPWVREFGLDYPFTWGNKGDGAWFHRDLFDGALMQWLCPCPIDGPGVVQHTPPLIGYPAALLGVYWMIAPPIVLIAGAVWAVRRWRVPFVSFSLALVVLNLGLVLVYFYQSFRLLAPAAAILAVLSGVALGEWGSRLLRRVRPSLGVATGRFVGWVRHATGVGLSAVAGVMRRVLGRVPGLPWAALIVLLVAFGAVAGMSLIRTLGLQYDEALFVNAAIDRDTTQFVTVRWGLVPIMLMDYIGALKAWLYAPVFAIFGTSIESIRIPMILLFAVTVLLAARFVWVRTRPWAAVIAVALLVTEPAFTIMSRNDWGPVMIPAFLRVVLLVVLVAVVTTRRRRWLVALVVVVAAGIFNKLDFGISAGALIGAALIAFLPEWRSLLLARPLRTLLAAGSLVVVVLLSVVLLYLPAQSRTSSFEGTFLERINQRFQLVGATFDGGTLAGYMTRGELAVGSLAIPLSLGVLAVVGAAAVAAIIARRPTDLSLAISGGPAVIGAGRMTAFLVLAGAFTMCGLIVVGQVSGPHHAAAMWPLPWLAVATGLAFLAELVRSRRLARPIAVGALGLAGALALGMVATQVAAHLSFVRVLTETSDRPPIWTFDTEDASDVVDALGGEAGPVIFADWGLANQLIAYDDRTPEDQFLDIWPEIVNSPPGDVLSGRGIVGSFVLVYHDDDSQIFDGSTEAAIGLIQECIQRGGASTGLYEGDDVVVEEVTCPAP